MSVHGGPLFEHGVRPTSSERPDEFPDLAARPYELGVTQPARPVEHHAQPAPTDYLCTCGKIREACVREEVRALWHAMTDDSAPRAPKSTRRDRPAPE
jgi:hypothetical protein